MILKPLVHLGDRFLLFSTFVQKIKKEEEEEIATCRPAAAGKNAAAEFCLSAWRVFETAGVASLSVRRDSKIDCNPRD